MNHLQLITGNKNFSSSSLRAWLCLKQFDLPFTEIKIDLFKSNSTEELGMYSPSLQVPVLIHEDIKVWDSLAICEYISETLLAGQGWPTSLKKRATARSISTELHADFQLFKKEWPMNCQLSVQMNSNDQLEKEINRLDAIMYCCCTKYADGGDYLFGDFSIVDCMFAPFAISLRAYGAQLSARSEQYINSLLANPHLKSWLEQAELELEDFCWGKIA